MCFGVVFAVWGAMHNYLQGVAGGVVICAVSALSLALNIGVIAWLLKD